MKEKLTAQFWDTVKPSVERRLVALQRTSYDNLKALPEGAGQGNEVINGNKVSFCAHTWERQPGELILVVQATVRTLFFGWCSYELGVVLAPNGSVREASSEEILCVL